MNRFNNIIQRYKILAAKYAGGDYSWSIGRPNYTAVDNTPTVLYTNRKFFAEPVNPSLTQDKLSNIELFTICGDASTFNQGDILNPNSADIPILTVVSRPEEQEFLAFKSPKIGEISNSGTTIYTYVYFDYLEANTLNFDSYRGINVSANEPFRRVVIYSRKNIYEGMIFKELPNNSTEVHEWQITLVDNRYNLIILHLKKPDMS